MSTENAMPGRPGEEISKDQTIKILTQQLNDMKLKAAPWVINFEVELGESSAGGYNVVITGKTASGRGVMETISADNLQYAAADVETFVKHTVNKFIIAILSESALTALRPQLSKAIISAVKLSTRSSL